jgi:hypothetical protein
MRIETLYPPANETAISYWEDPSFLIIKQWSPFKSYSNIIYQLKLILINTKIAIYHFAVYLFLLFLLFIFYPQKKELLKNRKLLLIIFSFLIYLPGLLLIMIEERFLIFPIIMLFTIIIFLASAIINKYIENKSKTFLIVFLISFIMIAKPIYSFVKNFNYGKSIHQLSLEIKNDTKLVGNIASRSEMPLNEDWSNSTYIAYVNSSKYFGEVKRNFTFEELVQELKKFDINYFFVWDKPIPLEQPKFILEKHYKISTTPVISNQIIDSAVTTIFNIFGLKNQRINKTKELWIYKFSKL